MGVKLRWVSNLALGSDESWSVASSFVEGVCEVNVQSGGRIRLSRSTVMCDVKSDQVVLSSSDRGGTVVKYG